MSDTEHLTLFKRIKEHYRIYIVVLIIVVIAETIGSYTFELGPLIVVLFPMVTALAIGALMCIKSVRFINLKEMKASSSMVFVAMTPFMAMLGVLVGADLSEIINYGWPLLLQEFGHLGTILLALPIAIMLGIKRESIGLTHSIGREANLGVGIGVFGTNSPEYRGLLSIYIISLIVGPIVGSISASLLASMNLFHPLAMGMAAGVGSGSVMAAITATLSNIYPNYTDQILVLAGASNALASFTSIYIAIFIIIPLTIKAYEWVEPKIAPKVSSGSDKSNESNKSD